MTLRVSTPQYFQTTIGNIGRQQSQLLDIQQQMSSGKRINSPADDPVSAGRSVSLDASRRSTEQFLRNQADLTGQLEYIDSFLSMAVNNLQEFRARLVQAGNGALSESDRRSVAQDLQALRDSLLSIANAQTETGAFIFAGFNTAEPPFVERPDGTNPRAVTFEGDAGARSIQVSVNRFIESSFSGAYLFTNLPLGDGRLTAAAGPNNQGTGLLGTSRIADAALWETVRSDSPFTFEILAGDQYRVLDRNGVEVQAASPIGTAPLSFTAGGVELSLSGTPEPGDQFTLTESREGSRSLFETMDLIISQITGPAGGNESTRRANALGESMFNIDRALDRLLEARAQVGSRLKEVEELGFRDREVRDTFVGEFSRLVDLDYVDAAGRLASKQLGLQAAQQSYARISQLSLFDVIR